MFWVEKVIGEVWLSSALLISTGLMRKLYDFGILHSLHAETVSSAASIYANRGWSDSPLSVWNVSSAVVNARLASHPLNRQCSEVSFWREHCGGAMKTPMSPIIEDDKLYDVRMQVEHVFLSASSRWSKPQRRRRCGRRPGCTWAAEYNGWPPPSWAVVTKWVPFRTVNCVQHLTVSSVSSEVPNLTRCRTRVGQWNARESCTFCGINLWVLQVKISFLWPLSVVLRRWRQQRRQAAEWGAECYCQQWMFWGLIRRFTLLAENSSRSESNLSWPNATVGMSWEKETTVSRGVEQRHPFISKSIMIYCSYCIKRPDTVALNLLLQKQEVEHRHLSE